MRRDSPFTASAPADQASGLRRLFAPVRRRLLPVAANPFVPAGQAILETLSAALAAQGRQVLVVDAAGTAPAPHETALFDLAAGVEQLHEQVCYLAARGVPLAHVDTHGSAAAFVDAAFDAAPQCDLVLLHADPTDLARMLGQRAVRPLLLGADGPDSIKQAYACCKLLAQRCGLMTFDLVLAANPRGRRVGAIAERLASCADTFLGAVLHDWAVVDPLADPQAAHDAALARVLAAQLALDDPGRPAPALHGRPLRTARPGAVPTPF
ncbi:MAG: flagellar biosynthesis protein [Rubrivivax sp.]|nr:flagellar biosynthesis protein [Rubrivivax sp.]